MATLGEMVTTVRRRVREPVAAFFSDQEIMEVINSVTQEYAEKTKAYPVEVSLLWNADMFSADLPAGWLHIIWSRLLNIQDDPNNDFGTYLQRIGAKGRTIGSKMDMGYFINDDVISLTPKTTQTSGTVIQVRYVPRPFEFANSVGDFFNSSDIQDSLIPGIIEGVLVELFDQQEREPQARRAERKYRDAITHGIKYFRDREGKQELTIRA